MARTFTVAEAETLLPVLESLLRSAIQAKELIEEVDAEQQALANRMFVNGGTLWMWSRWHAAKPNARKHCRAPRTP